MRIVLASLLMFLSAGLAWAQAPMPKAQRDAIAKNLADDSDMYSRFVYDDAQTVDKRVALYLPVMPDQDIQNWLIDHIAQILSVTPTLYPAHMDRVAKHFVKTGWAQYQTQWQNARIEDLVMNQNYSITALTINTPRIVAKGRQNTVDNPAYRWISEVPVMLTYAKPGAASQTFNITLRVGLVRIPMRDDNALIAIDEWTILNPAASATSRTAR